jgi:hypothetical protein
MQKSSQNLQNMFIFDTPIHVESDTWALFVTETFSVTTKKMVTDDASVTNEAETLKNRELIRKDFKRLTP